MTDQQPSLQSDVLALRNDVLRLDVNIGAALAGLRATLVEQAEEAAGRLRALGHAVDAYAGVEARFGEAIARMEEVNTAQAAEISDLKDERSKLREEIKALGDYIGRSNERHHASLNDMVRLYKEFDKKFCEFDARATTTLSQVTTVAETLILRMNETQRETIQYQKDILRLLTRLRDQDTVTPTFGDEEEVALDDLPPVKRGIVELVKASGLFDEMWYRERYGVRGSFDTLVRHYLTLGYRDGFSPGPDFDGAEYQRLYQDVANVGVNPLEHYLKSGKAEGRSAPPVAVRVIEF